jgi:hypothetical protein
VTGTDRIGAVGIRSSAVCSSSKDKYYVPGSWNVLLLIVVVISKFLLQSITTHIPGLFHLFL